MTDLIARLRNVRKTLARGEPVFDTDDLTDEAADALEAQAKEVAALRERLAEAERTIDLMARVAMSGDALPHRRGQVHAIDAARAALAPPTSAAGSTP